MCQKSLPEGWIWASPKIFPNWRPTWQSCIAKYPTKHNKSAEYIVRQKSQNLESTVQRLKQTLGEKV